MCVTDPWAHMGLVHSILSLKLGVTPYLNVPNQAIGEATRTASTKATS